MNQVKFFFAIWMVSLMILLYSCSEEGEKDRYSLVLDAYRKNQLDIVVLLLDGKDMNGLESEIYLKSLFYRNEFGKFLDKTSISLRDLSPEIFLFRMKAHLLLKRKPSKEEEFQLENYAKVSPEALLLLLKLFPSDLKTKKIDTLGTKIQEFQHYLSLMQKINSDKER
ncbi:MAG: hypothetical protein O9301_14890 [Leptospira sp.]|nr:hypothetical protein [Leptospira sp.]